MVAHILKFMIFKKPKKLTTCFYVKDYCTDWGKVIGNITNFFTNNVADITEKTIPPE